MAEHVPPKPTHLGPQYGAQFSDSSIINAYRYRAPYPDEVYRVLTDLLPDGPVIILDVGCGTGDLTLGLLANIPRIERLDAVDIAEEMIAVARQRPGADDPRLNWQTAPVETASFSPPYSLVTAGESLHWMDWPVVMPRFRDVLHPDGVLAIVGRSQLPMPWTDELMEIIQRHSTNRDFQPYDTVSELTSRGLFSVLGTSATPPVTHRQSIEDYIESWHSRNGLSRDRMGAGAIVFDDEVRTLLERHNQPDIVTFNVAGRVTWGLPAHESGQIEDR